MEIILNTLEFILLYKLLFFSQTYHEVISFLAGFAMKMQEGEYDAEPKEEAKVSLSDKT